MKSQVFLASISLAILTPSVAMAQDDGCRRDKSGRIIGTAAGAGVGGVIGNVVAGQGDKAEGTVIGAVVGAVIGSQVSKTDKADCRAAYGYYDKDGRWHSTGVSNSDARGYYDRDGHWVSGQPNGYYDHSGRWISASNDTNGGYTDRNGNWVPAASSGYYDNNQTWVSSSANGYYNTRGRWIAGATRGRYDARGRWIEGDSNPNSDNMEQPGYYKNGRWHEGQAYGYYDRRGRWVPVEARYSSAGNGFGDSRYQMDQMPTGVQERISWLREYVNASEQAGRTKRAEANYARTELTATEKLRLSYTRDGRLSQKEQRTIDQRLNRLTNRLDRNWRQTRAH